MKTTDLLSLPSRGFPRLVGDAEGLFMFCHEIAGDHLAERLRSKRILELCCGVGAITAQLSRYATVVFAVDADPLRIRCAEINVETYGNPNNAQFSVEYVSDDTNTALNDLLGGILPLNMSRSNASTSLDPSHSSPRWATVFSLRDLSQ